MSLCKMCVSCSFFYSDCQKRTGLCPGIHGYLAYWPFVTSIWDKIRFHVLRLSVQVDTSETLTMIFVCTQPGLIKDVHAFMRRLDFGGAKADASEEEVDDQGPWGVIAGPSATSNEKTLQFTSPVENTPVNKKSGKGAWVRAVLTGDEENKPFRLLHSHVRQIIEPSPVWHAIEMPPLPTATSRAPSSATLEMAKQRAKDLLEREASHYASALSPSKTLNPDYPVPLSNSDRTFFATVLSSGTSSDKLSALVLVTSSSPVHALHYLNQLMSICKKKSREEATRAIRAVVDWLKGGEGGDAGGLPDRKLKWFKDQPGLPAVASNAKLHGDNKRTSNLACPEDAWLVLWAFEDWLKQWYFDLLGIIEVCVCLMFDDLTILRLLQTMLISIP
jgi:ribosome biogenesis protein MAK21